MFDLAIDSKRGCDILNMKIGDLVVGGTIRSRAIGLRQEDDGTPSLRRTMAAIIDKQTGNLRAVQILLGHTKIESTVIESTVRYLGVAVYEALTLSERTGI